MTDKPDTMPAWVRAVDEAMVSHHLGVADASDDYETATRKLNDLLCHAQSIGEYFARQHAEERCAALVEAAYALLRWHLDRVDVHPCDADRDDVRVRSCTREAQTLYAAIAAHKEKQ